VIGDSVAKAAKVELPKDRVVVGRGGVQDGVLTDEDRRGGGEGVVCGGSVRRRGEVLPKRDREVPRGRLVDGDTLACSVVLQRVLVLVGWLKGHNQFDVLGDEKGHLRTVG
jgi:hypothetical protein